MSRLIDACGWRARRRGFSLVELMVGMALGLIASAAAGAAFLNAHAAYLATTDRVLIEERGQRALAILSMLLRQSGWPGEPASGMAGTALPVVSGADNCGQPAMAAAPACARAAVGQSDALLVRFSGSGLPAAPAQPDDTMTDCSGYPVAASAAGTEASAGYVAENLLYVAAGADGVPQLLCRYPARRNGLIDGNGWTSGALVRGVESLQLRYGLDLDQDGRPERFETASAIASQGDAAWQRVVAVQLAIAVRGDRPGSATPVRASATDTPALPGTAAADLPPAAPAQAGTARRVFVAAVRLRNAPRCQETLC
ncbi:PilW family protein [Cupriavidus taiwanensis]|uniref:PilW family protein n=1 Tax=Cupriavidus taiwanensis TaxID=164546 RepID=UPI000E16D2A6|nr:PilW family protein [Cupriavidus taiwanensis]SOZ23191.1 putative type 4 fimbrial biogenesis pilW-related transmembrane protein precursor [Cupriavidus taiwanensis]SPA27571.1 putative type 4 fimbrial biogenesis pilW-related transmembrane protein precursor [Cupriavidus taiwanensis]